MSISLGQELSGHECPHILFAEGSAASNPTRIPLARNLEREEEIEMNKRVLYYVGTVALFLFLTPPAGAQSFQESLKQALEKLKQLQVQKGSSSTGQVASPSPNVSKPAPAQNGADARGNTAMNSASEKASGSKPQGGQGPDVIGIRLRMTPAEVATAIRARSDLPKSHEFVSTLQYRLPTGAYADVQNGEFHKVSVAYKRGLGGNDLREGLLVYFAPTPAHNSVIAISRFRVYLPQNRPAYETVIKALIAKYGPPSYRGNQGGLDTNLIWSYDRDLRPRSAHIDPYGYVCQEVPQAKFDNVMPNNGGEVDRNWALDSEISRSGQRTVTNCGYATLKVEVGTTHTSPALVTLLDTRFTDVGDAIVAQRDAGRIVSAAESSALGRQMQKAKKLKPDL